MKIKYFLKKLAIAALPILVTVTIIGVQLAFAESSSLKCGEIDQKPYDFCP